MGDVDEIPRINNIQFTNFYNPPFTSALLGSTKSGKTTFLNSIVPKIAKKFDLILLFSNSLTTNYEEIKHLPNVFAREEYSEQILEDLYEVQKKVSYADTTPENQRLQILIILDDEIDSKKAKLVEKLFCIMRNSNFSIIFSGQDYSFLKKSSRNNINHLFIFKQNSAQAYEDIYKHFFKDILEEKLEIPMKIPKYQRAAAAKKFLQENTKDHDIILFDILNDYNLYIIDKSYVNN